jgi:hypothetical protein
MESWQMRWGLERLYRFVSVGSSLFFLWKLKPLNHILSKNEIFENKSHLFAFKTLEV